MLKNFKFNYRLYAILLTFMVLFRTIMCYERLRAGQSAEYLLPTYLADNCLNVVAALLLTAMNSMRPKRKVETDAGQ